jgi:non-specific serine/threonine protein kinase
VTLTGSGGVGKTRLSLQAAGELVDQFSGGAWLVELAPLTDPALVPQHVAAALGVRENPGRSILESLLLFLRGRELLLVLDNCEHLLEACAQLVEGLLRDSPSLKVLASSREPLGITGEAVLAVRSLPFPDPAHLPPIEEFREYTAVSLFVDRARLVMPDYQATEHNAAAIARICQRLDGIPLAIEMAAARVNVLSAASLAERLEDSFRVLTGGSRTAMPRQQTLRAMIDWSYDLLTESERRLLQRLSVFAGGCTLEAVEVICADTTEAAPEPAVPKIGDSEILDLLSSVVSKSMVNAERKPGDTRYRLLETVRQYAREKLHAAGEGDSVRSRHLRYFVQLAQEAEPELYGPDQIAWLDRLEADLDNLRAALEYSQANRPSGEAEDGLRMAVALESFWHIRGHRLEARTWLESALERHNVAERSLIRAEALRLAADLYTTTMEVNLNEATESVEIFREAGVPGRRGLAYALITLSSIRHFQGDFGPTTAMLNESIGLFREMEDMWGLARGLHNLAATLDPLVNYQPRGKNGSPAPLPDLAPAARNDHSAERDLFEESLGLFRQLGDRYGQAMALGSLGLLYLGWGERQLGQAMYQEQLQIYREFGDNEGMAHILGHMGRDALAHDELERAAMLFDECQAMLGAVHEDNRDPMIFFLQGEVARRRADYAQAIPLMQTAMAWCLTVGNPDFIAAVLDGQGRVARSQGEYATAHRLHLEALALRRQAGHPINLAHSFHALALLAADRDIDAERDDEAERAARLFGGAHPYYPALYAYWAALPIWRAEHEHGVAAVQARLGDARSAALIAEGEAMTLEQAYNYALAS